MLFEALMELRNEAVEAGDYKVACILFVLCGAMAEGEESLMELSVRCVEYAKERLKMESELMTDKNALQLPLLEVQEKITKIRKLSLDDLPSNQRLGIPAGHPTTEFVEDILHRGQLESIKVVNLKDGNQFVEQGRKRIAAFRILRDRFPDEKKWTRIRAEIAEAEDFMSVLMAASAGNNQRHQNVLTDLQAIQYCQDNYPGMRDKDISRYTGIHPSTLKSRKTLFKLQPVWWDLFQAGKLLTTTAVEIAKQTPEIQHNLWADYQKNDQKITKEHIAEAQRVRRETTVMEHQDRLFPEVDIGGTTPMEPIVHDPSICPYCGQDMPEGE
jgi:hypothetical protein